MTGMTQTTANRMNDEAALGLERAEPRFRVRDYLNLMKPRVMTLVVFTAMVGLVMAPGQIPEWQALIALLCISVGASSSGAINMWYDRDIDQHMERTQKRPIPAGYITPAQALIFGLATGVSSVVTMALAVNPLSAALLAGTILYYVFLYTMWLKRKTPQNIVIGGASGALPPVIGWAAVTGDIGLGAVIMFLIIFLWTPPHSWALALFRRDDYANAKVPMLPVVAGVRATKRQMAAYTALMALSAFAPLTTGMAGGVYAVIVLGLNIRFCQHMWRVWREDDDVSGRESKTRPLFFYSIVYLFMIFVALLADRALFLPIGA